MEAAPRGERSCLKLLRCARIFEAVGRADEAEAIRASAVKELVNPALIISLMRRLSGPDWAADLRRICRHVEQHLSNSLDLLAYVAWTLDSTGDLSGAQRVYRVAIKAYPQSAEMPARLGQLLLKRGKPKSAVVFLQKALSLDARNPALLKKLTEAYFKGSAYEQAQESARALIALTPDDASAHISLASALRRAGRSQDALVHAVRAAELAPEDPRYSRFVEELTKASVRR